MRWRATLVTVWLLLGLSVDAERKWQTGTWFSAGVKRTSWVTGAAGRSSAITASGTVAPRAEVGIYVIDSPSMRLEIEDIVPIGSSSIESELKVGGPVTFAVEKSSVYVRGPKGIEHRLRITKKTVKDAR